MDGMSRQPGDMRPGGGGGPGLPGGSSSSSSNWRWVAVVLVTIGILALVLSSMRGSGNTTSQTYSEFHTALVGHNVKSATVNKDTGHVSWTNADGQQFSTQGPELNANAGQLALYT